MHPGVARWPPRRLLAFALVAAVGCALDLATKEAIFARLGMPGTSEPIWIWPNVFCLTTSLNEGALFGIGQGQVRAFTLLSLVAAVGIVYWLLFGGAIASRWLVVALGAIMGGVLGNLYDRLGLPGLVWNYPPSRIGEPVYAVRDWLYFSLIEFPVFNVADSLLVCGVAMILLSGAFPHLCHARGQSTGCSDSPSKAESAARSQ